MSKEGKVSNTHKPNEERMIEIERENLFQEVTHDRVRKRRKRSTSAPVFKLYSQHQTMILPPSLAELIPE